VELRETVGAGSGSLALLVDGTSVSGGSKLYLGTQGLTGFAVGERFSPPGSGTAGHLYIDNVTTTSTTAAANTPATTSAAGESTTG
jgi:hypothetical protein